MRQDPHRMRALREHRGLSQGELALLVKCSQPLISLYESGGASAAQGTLERIAWHLDVDVTQLMTQSLRCEHCGQVMPTATEAQEAAS